MLQVIQTLGLFLVQPLFLLGLLMTVGSYFLRLKNERQNFRIAIDRDFYEGRHFIKQGLLFLGAGLLFTLIFHYTLPLEVFYLYQVLAIVALLLINFCDLSLWALLLAGGAPLVLQSLGIKAGNLFIPATLPTNYGAMIFWTLALLALFKANLTRLDRAEWFSPKISQGKRGRRIVGYFWRAFTVFPLVLFTPQTSLSALGDFSNYGTKIFIVPFFVGAVCHIYKQVPVTALKFRRAQSLIVAGLAFLLGGLSYFWPNVTLYGLALLGVLLLWQAFKRRQADHQAKRWYVETSEGVRIVAIKPETPAAKMKLEVGDIILECNGLKVATSDELYEALQKDPAYCHLKVKNFEGELKLAESAIYADSPHEIGLVLFG